MVTIPYNQNIPNAPNNPSQDQPKMQQNTNGINQIIGVDHYSFGSSGSRDGWHTQSTYPVLASAPTTLVLQGAVYTKDVGAGVVQLFYRRESDGVEIQLTQLGKVFNTPTILSGTFNSTGAFTDVVLLPQNVYGYIIFFRTAATRAAQISSFVTTTTTTHGMSTRVVRNGSSDDDPVELNNNSATLFLQGRTDDFGNQTYDWRLHYWEL